MPKIRQLGIYSSWLGITVPAVPAVLTTRIFVFLVGGRLVFHGRVYSREATCMVYSALLYYDAARSLLCRSL